jgi:cytochrome b pre-mRNA-processing protein 3
MGVFGFLGRARHERAGFELYGAAVAAARAPFYYETLGVPDTMDGRFDLVGLFAALLIRRLRVAELGAGAAGTDLAQAVFDAMFADMDFNLRELGVGDLSVAKKMRAMWEAFHGRATAYQGPLDAGDAAALADAAARNVWRGHPPVEGPATLARVALRQAGHLQSQAFSDLRAGKVTFLPASEAALP